jgi:hypothetical protein
MEKVAESWATFDDVLRVREERVKEKWLEEWLARKVTDLRF